MPGLLRSDNKAEGKQFSAIDDDYDSDFQQKMEEHIKKEVEQLKVIVFKEISSQCQEVKDDTQAKLEKAEVGYKS